MTGLLCGTMPESTLTETVARTPAKTDVETTVRSRGEYTLGVTYPESRDPAGWRVYDDDGVTGLLYGAVPALADGTRSPEAFFEGALENPAETLSAVDRMARESQDLHAAIENVLMTYLSTRND